MRKNCGFINASWFICIEFQCGGTSLRCIYSIPKKIPDDQVDRHKITRVPQLTGHIDGQTYYTATQGI